MAVGEKIRSIRKERGLTQKGLGELCGINEANIRKYELGNQNPKLDTLTKIATALNISVTALISPEGITLRKENTAIEALKSILESIYDEVEINWNKTISCNNDAEYDGDYTVFLKKGTEEILLNKQSYETLFEFIRKNIPIFIDMIDRQNNK